MLRVSAALVVVLVVCALGAEDDKYTTQYDGVDIDSILRNDRLLTNYHNCLISDNNKGCTKDALELKGNIGDALTNDCSKCSEAQKTKGEKVIRYLYNNKKDMWKALEAKYDPQHIYTTKYQEELKKFEIPA